MSSKTRYSKFDAFAFSYSDEGIESCNIWLVLMEKFILQHLPKDAHILDLCCGTGELVQRLQIKGYQAIGLDGSEEMLHYAHKNTPGCKFILDDARFFKLPPTFHAVVSAHNSLSYVTKLEELASVFQNVYAAMMENGWFAFDLSQEERMKGNTSKSNFADDFAIIQSHSYNSEEKIGRESFVIFRLIDGGWQRSDTTLIQRPYSIAEVQSALERVGFTEISFYDAERDLGVDGMAERIFYICRKPLSSYDNSK